MTRRMVGGTVDAAGLARLHFATLSREQQATTIRRLAGTFPRPSPMWSTSCGSTQTPRFAIAAYAEAIWIGVTAMPWPIGTLPIVDPDHRSSGSTIPALSPG